VRAAPKLTEITDAQPLAGLRICVDAGHCPDTGAVGCTRVIERDVNILIAKDLAQMLRDKGATVIMTRESNECVALYERPRIAWQNHADILISCHNNALADGGNPLINNGYGVYYANPWSFALAKEIHAAYADVIGDKSNLTPPLNDDGLHYGKSRPTKNPRNALGSYRIRLHDSSARGISANHRRFSKTMRRCNGQRHRTLY